MYYIIIIACVVPACITMFTYYSRKRRITETINSREAFSLNLQYDDKFYSVKRSKSALKKNRSRSSSNSRKSVQFNEVVLEVFDLINDDEANDILSSKPSCPKIVKSSLKNEKVSVPIRCSNTIFPKSIINEYNGEIIDFKNKEEKNKQENIIEDTKFISVESQYPEILIIKNNDESDNDSEITLTNSPISSNQLSDVAKKVITSEANSASNLINSNNEIQKSNTLPRRSRPNFKGHRRQSSVRLTCIY